MDRRVASLFLALSVLPGCSDSTGPGLIGIRVAGAPDLRHVELDGETGILCGIPLEISVGPDAEGSAEWIAGRLRFKSATTGGVVEVGEIGDESYDGLPIGAGSNRTEYWRFWTSETFELDGTFRYRLTTSGDVIEASFSFTCLPDAPVPSGNWKLESIDGEPLPTFGTRVIEVHHATLQFNPRNLTVDVAATVGFSREERGGEILVRFDQDGTTWIREIVPDFGAVGRIIRHDGGRMEIQEGSPASAPNPIWEFAPL